MLAASTLGDSWNWLPNCSKTPDLQPMPVGLRFSPPSLATLDLPQARILLVVDDVITALDLQRLLHEAGYRVVGPATTVGEIQRMIRRGDIDCAILDPDVDRRAPLPIADLLAFAEVPFVYLSTGVVGLPSSRHRHRPVVEKPFTRESLIAALEKAMAKSRQTANDNPCSSGGLVVPEARVYPPL